jgi:hypothetical protein
VQLLNYLYFGIYVFLIETRKEDDDFGRLKVAYVSNVLLSLAICFNVLLPLSYFMPWIKAVYFIWFFIGRTCNLFPFHTQRTIQSTSERKVEGKSKTVFGLVHCCIDSRVFHISQANVVYCS